MRFEAVKLSEVADIIVGFAFKSQDFNTNGIGVRLVRGKNITRRSLRWGEDTRWWNDFSFNLDRYYLREKDIVIGMDGSLVGKNYAKINASDLPLLLVQRVACIRAKEGVSQDYLWQIIATPLFENYIDAVKTGTTIPHISGKQIGEYEIPYCNAETQERIASILSVTEEKIRLNTAINENLESQAQALYNKFFSPKSNSTGTIKTLDMYCSIFTGKKNANAAIDNGSYKFFTCSPDALKIDSYIYDGNAIIISGNGAYTGRTRFYSGKFDLYQRTYACTILSELNPDYIYPLYWFVKFELSQKIMGGTRGSAIPYIVMNDLAKFEFVFNEDSFNQYMIMFKNITLAIQQNEFENEKLALLRDTLLPKLMNGEIDVSEVKI